MLTCSHFMVITSNECFLRWILWECCVEQHQLIKMAFLNLFINPVHFFLVMHRSFVAPWIPGARRNHRGDKPFLCPQWKFKSHQIDQEFCNGTVVPWQLQEIKRKQTWCVHGSQTKLNNYLDPVFRAAFERIPTLFLQGLGAERTCLIWADIRQQFSVPTCWYSDLVSCLMG